MRTEKNPQQAIWHKRNDFVILYSYFGESSNNSSTFLILQKMLDTLTDFRL